MATQNRHLTPKKTTLDEAIATDIAINIIAIQYLKFFLKKLSKNVATCLTLTELGYCPFSANGSHLLFQLISRRYESKSTVITSNRPVSDWGLILGDTTAATAILDRLLHHCSVLTINGDSYRLLAAKKANLLAKNESLS